MKPDPKPPFDFYNTTLINVLVTVICVQPGTGNAGKNKEYEVECDDLHVRHRNTIINFRLVPPTPHHIIFTGVTPDYPAEFSPASVSVDRKMITFSDLNSKKDNINIFLEFALVSKDNEFQDTFSHDPQVGNDPVVLEPPHAAQLE
ncbi:MULTISPECIES: hypothetical protein [unclassified Janthinobacterium]|uniref:hypothetical protein n=1 Tax=unclassified Janthinobacterium TaxID=2610881 RepID=UPI00161C5923|nr:MULTISPECIES: hypothetical protein [unclassified Janthinobacterium]MBB5367087.1 hypothetical protein [Janthinobacterium sp. K2C7]MBB5380435.1 hypothetical protein [Janthinobacterium sp. K2Li3]MBB5385469.1 hypothetical protein [Janthinobacterium sp. K2E3]